MKDKTEKSQTLIYKLMDHLENTDKIPSLSSDLNIEMNQIPFHLRAQNGAAILSFDSWSNAFSFLKIVRKSDLAQNVSFRQLQALLKKINLTFYLQNKRFALIGPRAGSIVPKFLTLASLFFKK